MYKVTINKLIQVTISNTNVKLYPIGWMFIAEPLARRITPGLNWFVVAVIYGIGLWIFALYIMASLIAGQPAFLGFTGITWVALLGHVLFAIVAAMVVRWRDGQARMAM